MTDRAAGSVAARSELDTIAVDAWESILGTAPLFATAIGDKRFAARMADRSPAGLEAARGAFTGLLARLDAIEPSPAEAVTHAAVREVLEGELTFVETGLLAWNVDPMDGIPVPLLQVADYQPVATAEDRAALLERWRAMGPAVDDFAASVRARLVDGLVSSRAPVERVIDILATQLAAPDAESVLAAPVARARGSATDADAAALDRWGAEVVDAIATSVRPAFARLHATLVDAILPAARPDERPGLLHVPGGDEAYRRIVRAHTSLDWEPERYHATGVAEIARIDAEMEALGARVLGTRTRREAIAALRADPALHFTTRDEVEAQAVEALARATQVIPAWFGRLPKAPCEVVRMGAHEEEHSTIAYYRHPAEDGSRPGHYAINTSHPETRPRYEAEVLAYHESIPGHHLQIAIAQELDGLPSIRRHLGPTAFIEGWGLYIERLADEMGLYTGDLDRIGVLSFDAWRASRLVVDTGIHALGWTRDQAIAYMLDHTALGENNVVNEVDRYIVYPGQALAYKTGQLELLRLRDEARDRLGPAWDIRAFHDTVLGEGAISLPVLRGIVDAWIERTAAA
jgi:uncharacterized protein (DUF885 family)